MNIVSLKKSFRSWVSAALQRAPEERTRLFMTEVADRNADYYNALVFEGIPEEARRVKLVAAGALDYLEKSVELEEAFDFTAAGLRAFAGEFMGMFPDCGQGMTLVVMQALGRFDGREKLLNGVPVAGFGVECFLAGSGQNAHSREKELRLTAAHEMFHLYHGMKTGIWQERGRPVITWVWVDGLAAYASKQLNPGATYADALGGDELGRACSGSFRDFFHVAAPALLSVDTEDQRALFNAGRHYNGLPTRIGYALGLMAVEQLAAKGFSLAEMSSWPEERATAELRSVFFSW